MEAKARLSNWLNRSEAGSSVDIVVSTCWSAEAFIADAANFFSFLGDSAMTITTCVACLGLRYLSTRTGEMGNWEVVT